jgi:hypothetical protein
MLSQHDRLLPGGWPENVGRQMNHASLAITSLARRELRARMVDLPNVSCAYMHVPLVLRRRKHNCMTYFGYKSSGRLPKCPSDSICRQMLLRYAFVVVYMCICDEQTLPKHARPARPHNLCITYPSLKYLKTQPSQDELLQFDLQRLKHDCGEFQQISTTSRIHV